MTASPFSNFEQFQAATENIASFSQYPAFNYIMTAISAVLCLWFLVSSFTIKR